MCGYSCYCAYRIVYVLSYVFSVQGDNTLRTKKGGMTVKPYPRLADFWPPPFLNFNTITQQKERTFEGGYEFVYR